MPNSADEPLVRSFLDNAPLFRGKQLVCPINGVRMIALVPTLDAVANPPGLHPEIPVIEVRGVHGLLIDDADARARLIGFLGDGHVVPRRRWDYTALQAAGAAWQTPALKVQLNPVWDTVGGRSARNYRTDECLLR